MAKMKLIVIDPGHGGDDRANVGPTGFVEADGNLQKAFALRDKLITKYDNVIVVLTREGDVTRSLTERGRMGADADLFISIHSNAGGRGSEVYYSVDIPDDEQFAADLSASYASAFNTIDRGAKVRESKKYPGEDYYTVIDQAQDNGAEHVLLTEDLFHSDQAEEAVLKSDWGVQTYADITSSLIGLYLNLDNAPDDDVPEMYREAWDKAVLAGIEDGYGPNEVVTSAKFCKYLDKLGFLDFILDAKGENV